VGTGGFGINFLTFYPIPSGEFSLFLGGALPVAPRRPGHWIALGYRGTASVGMAEVSPDLESWDLFAHRHQLAVQGVAGRRSRLAYGASLGIAGFAANSTNHEYNRRGKVALEAEGRIGYIFGKPAPMGALATFGVQLRLSSRLPEPPAYPTIGLFFSFAFGNGLPEAPR
jgi:hypothetical protein